MILGVIFVVLILGLITYRLSEILSENTKAPKASIKDLKRFLAETNRFIENLGTLTVGALGCLFYGAVMVLLFCCLGILGYAVIIFLIKFVRSNLTL